MDTVTIQRVMVIARQESVELKHYYVGVEHLFLALTRFKGSVTADVLEQKGLLGYFLNYLSREAFRHSDEQRYWPDFRNTQRADKILDDAQDNIDQGLFPEDRALLLAILDEGDSLPIRVLQELGVDTAALRESVLGWSGGSKVQVPRIPIELDDPAVRLTPAEESVLLEMFQDAGQIHIKRALQDGYSGASVLLVQPVRHNLMYAPVVVKLDDRQSIQYEKLRYDQWVKDILPPTSARIIDEPTLPIDSNLGGIRYTFVHKQGLDAPVNLREYTAQDGEHDIAAFIRTALYDVFRPYWWGQSQPYHFQVWQEYELLLPPALVVEILAESTAKVTTRTLYPKGTWSYKGGVRVGEVLILENFVAQKAKPDQAILQISAGAQSEASDRSSRIEVRGIDLDQSPYPRGQAIKRLVVRVLRTRDDILQEQVQSLEPDFDILAEKLTDPSGQLTLPNPLIAYKWLLDRWVDGTLSPIHGDLHMGNILMGPAGDAWLIDYEWTRQGHSLFDWAVLEISLVVELLVPSMGESWAECWELIDVLNGLNRQGEIPDGLSAAVNKALQPVHEVRGIARELLSPSALWSEYYIALALCAIRVPSWKNRSVATRRLMFLLSALYMDAARTHDPTEHPTGTLTKTATDLRRTNLLSSTDSAESSEDC